jgi:carbon starvation protein
MFSREIGEKLAGRTGGAVSLAVGMAQIFRGIPGSDKLVSYWYHYAIMFEALFILTVIDTGTRIARYVMHELLGRVYKPFGTQTWLPGNLIGTFLVVFGWGYLIWTGSISTIWPLFGTANQLLATIALGVTTTFLINMGRAKYAWVSLMPMIFVGVTTVSAGVLTIPTIFWPLTHVPGQHMVGYLNSGLMTFFIISVLVVSFEAVRRWIKTLSGEPIPPEAFGPIKEMGEETVKTGCC